ncbi:MAG: 7-carboxy-7-deazaguanine synthase QueE [Candidatus Omnitrophota bacterium]|nr:MAG: 7-carboxy-7-deazaguanine synthase QueE [Candidatus Omnitrophota bacterium]
MKAKISEIFQSTQGEGIYQGEQQVFVRFFGCNLNCSFCDTQLNFYEELTVEKVLEKIRSYSNYHSISLTGGEPLLQVDFLRDLAQCLKSQSQIVYLETNGTLPGHFREVIEYVDIIAMDFKLPSSTALKNFWVEHREFLKRAQGREVFVKTVITPSTLIDDVHCALAIIKEICREITFVLQPAHPFEDAVRQKLWYFENVCKELEMDVRIIPQLHKELGIK